MLLTTAGPNGATKARRGTALLVVAALAAAAMQGCSSSAPAKSPPSTSTTTTPQPPPKPTAAPTNPLTGRAPVPAGPVIAVKLDDTAAGRPTLGLEKADVIYLEEVEGGLTRMLAVFASAKPSVRAVRSIRASDPELLGQYGKIIVVASGGAPHAMRVLDLSNLHSVIHDRAEVGFFRDYSRSAPYNVASDLARVSAAIKAAGVRNVGFRWAATDARPAGGTPAATVSTRVGNTPVGFVWDPALARYVRTVGGQRVLAASGAPIAKPNVIVQYCQVSADYSDVDVRGNPSAFTKTVGSGRVVLFRGGKRIEGKWSRPSIGSPTTLTDSAGKPLLLAPGGTFVALVRTGAPA